MIYEEKIIERKKMFKGNIIDVEKYTVELPNGKITTRDVVVHPGAAVIIPISQKGEVYLVKQYRTPIEKVLLELPAGKLDPGEAPEICAARELKEETGLNADCIKHVISIHSTPGFCNEVLHVFMATGLHEGNSCADEDEFISSVKIHIGKLIEMIFNHEITDAKSIIGIMIAERIINKEV
ncbi:MAG TPA: NUDIX hydrolase [Clostridiales bacterium]|nr:NUDIX hydrolase [Clostridiales bacterium]